MRAEDCVTEWQELPHNLAGVYIYIYIYIHTCIYIYTNIHINIYI